MTCYNSCFIINPLGVITKNVNLIRVYAIPKDCTSFSIIPFVLVTRLYFFFVLARILFSCSHIICFKNFLCMSLFLKLCRIRNNGLFNSLTKISWSFLWVGFYFIYILFHFLCHFLTRY